MTCQAIIHTFANDKTLDLYPLLQVTAMVRLDELFSEGKLLFWEPLDLYQIDDTLSRQIQTQSQNWQNPATFNTCRSLWPMSSDDWIWYVNVTLETRNNIKIVPFKDTNTYFSRIVLTWHMRDLMYQMWTTLRFFKTLCKFAGSKHNSIKTQLTGKCLTQIVV